MNFSKMISAMVVISTLNVCVPKAGAAEVAAGIVGIGSTAFTTFSAIMNCPSTGNGKRAALCLGVHGLSVTLISLVLLKKMEQVQPLAYQYEMGQTESPAPALIAVVNEYQELAKQEGIALSFEEAVSEITAL